MQLMQFSRGVLVPCHKALPVHRQLFFREVGVQARYINSMVQADLGTVLSKQTSLAPGPTSVYRLV